MFQALRESPAWEIPAYEIIQYAENNAVDLIMMPTHGYGPFRSLLLGSTAAKVLHDAHCPVWTSAHIEETPLEARTEIHNILCAIELDTESSKLLRSPMNWRKHGRRSSNWFTPFPRTKRGLKSIWRGIIGPL